MLFIFRMMTWEIQNHAEKDVSWLRFYKCCVVGKWYRNFATPLEGLKLKLQYFGHPMQRANSLEKTLMLGKIEGEEKGATKDEMVGWHHWLNGCEFEQTPGDGEGQGSLVCCSSWGCKESDMTEWLNDKIGSSTVDTKLIRRQNHLEGLLKPSLLGPTLRVFDL